MSIAIVTDSTAGLNPHDLPDFMEIVPIHVIIDGDTFQEGQDIRTADVAKSIAAGADVSTARPSPQTFADVYSRLIAAGAEAIVSVHLSAELSSTYESARVAAAEVSVPITVIDSASIGRALGYAALAGAAVRDSGGDHQQIAGAINEALHSSTVTFYVPTMEYLRKGGRMGRSAALVASALAIKPILQVQKGQVELRERVRTASRALQRLTALSVDLVQDHQQAHSDNPVVTVHHGPADQDAQKVKSVIKEDTGVDVELVSLGSVISAHAGPNCVGVVVAMNPLSLVADKKKLLQHNYWRERKEA